MLSGYLGFVGPVQVYSIQFNVTILNPVSIIQAISVLFSVNCKPANTCSGSRYAKSNLDKRFLSVLLKALFVLLLLCLYTMAYAVTNYNTGAFYFANGDYNTALQIWAPLAQEGNPAAQYSIGLLYDQGKGVKKDPQTALKYFQAAVKQNLPAAQYYLGVKYYAGLGVKKSPVKALELIRRAAEQDHLQAQFQLAYFYDTGVATAVNFKKATRWYQQAAENGFGPAQHALAARYLTGHGIVLNLKQGIFWMKKAAQQKNSDAMRDLGFLYYQGIDIKQDWARARELLQEPAEEGSALAQYILGEMYAQGGHGIKKNSYQARFWLSKASQSGNHDARERLDKSATSHSSHNKNHTKNTAAITSSTSHKPETTKLDNHRFKQLDNNQYTIQLLQARLFQSIQHIIRQYRDKQTYVLKITRNNEPFYVLSYGNFTNYQQAKQQTAHLPKAFQLKSQPWIRKTAQLKPLLDTN